MSKSPVILALDLGTLSGYALGSKGSPPYAGSIQLPNDSEPARFSAFMRLTARLIQRQRPDVIAVEEKVKGRNGMQSLSVMLGFHGIAAGQAGLIGAKLQVVPVASIRGWCLPQHAAKHRTKEEVHGWAVDAGLIDRRADWHASDAVALWAYVAGWPQPGLDV